MHQKIEGKWWSEWARRSRVGSKRRLRRKREREEEGVGAGWMDGCGFTQSEQRWPGSVTIHPLECTLFPPQTPPTSFQMRIESLYSPFNPFFYLRVAFFHRKILNRIASERTGFYLDLRDRRLCLEGLLVEYHIQSTCQMNR